MLAEVPTSEVVIDVTPTLRKFCQPGCSLATKRLRSGLK